MKKRMMVALACVLCLFASCALAQTLPSAEVFSPGLMRANEMAGRGERVEMRASMTAADIAYARDLSVLASMLSGTEFVYAGWGSAAQGADRLTIEKEGQTLLALGMDREESGALVDVDGEVFAVDLSGMDEPIWAADAVTGIALLERVPLLSVCEAIESLAVGDALVGGFAVTQAFSVERTMSDDGTRLTRIDIEGSIAREGEAPWVIAGYLRQPAGRSPKDTFELTATQDGANYLELSYSSLRQSEVTRKDKAGTMNVDTTLRAVGKLEGSKFNSRLTVYLRNAWTADGENLNEKVTVNATLAQTDNRPAQVVNNLNDISAKLRFVVSMATAESGQETIALDEDLTCSVVLDGITFLDAAADIAFAVGGEGGGTALEPAAAQAAGAGELRGALDEAVITLAQKLYAQLGDSAKSKIESGL